MDGLQFGWLASVVAMGWFLPIGVIRLLAHRSGQVDHTPGMRNVAVLALTLGAVATVCMIVLTILIVTR